MSIAHLLEDFGIRIGLRQSRDITPVAEDMRESLRLDAYEDGYKAGWEDAVDANASEKQQIAADLAQNLRDLSFTYQEACSQVTRSMEEVFDGLSQSFLPSLAQHAFWPKVAEEIKGLSAQTGEGRFLLHVAPENIKVAKSLGSMMQGVQVSFREDPSLTSGQVVIGTEASEVSVDFDTLLEEGASGSAHIDTHIRKGIDPWLMARMDCQITTPSLGVPIEISVRVGAATPTVGELLALGPQSVLTLDAQVDDPVSLYVGDKLIAKGQLEEKQGSASGQLIVRLTEVADLSGSLA